MTVIRKGMLAVRSCIRLMSARHWRFQWCEKAQFGHLDRVWTKPAEFQADEAGTNRLEIKDRRAAEHTAVLKDGLPFASLVIPHLKFNLIGVIPQFPPS
jgi:hypothetical protein